MDRACPELRINLALGFVQDAGFSKCKGGCSGDSILTAIDFIIILLYIAKGNQSITFIKLVNNKCSRDGG